MVFIDWAYLGAGLYCDAISGAKRKGSGFLLL